MDFHPITAIFPLVEGAEFDTLVEDIRTNGLREPVWLHPGDGSIIDGRNRYRACAKAKIEVKTRKWNGKGSLVEFVLSMNLHRRHLTRGQQACVATEMLPWLEAEAKGRMAAGGRLKGTEKIPHLSESREKAGELAGVNPHYVTDAKKLKVDHPALYGEVRSGCKTLTEAKRAVREENREKKRQENRKLVEQAPTVVTAAGEEKYQTIVLDPPWDWGDEGDVDQLGRAKPTYATMSIDEIAALPVSDIVAENAHLYLWITNRSLPKGFALLERWGFRYVTMLTWVKPSYGMGNYFRGSTEQVLFGVKGSLPLLRNDVGTHFFAERVGRHSAKPPEFYALVETCSPGPWIEMFSRQPRQGWVSWGAEALNGKAVLI